MPLSVREKNKARGKGKIYPFRSQQRRRRRWAGLERLLAGALDAARRRGLTEDGDEDEEDSRSDTHDCDCEVCDVNGRLDAGLSDK